MTIGLRGFRVLISGPADTAEDADLVRTLIHQWNDAHAASRGVVFLPLHYQSNAVPVYKDGVDGQYIINQQLTSNSDVVIGLFRYRLGTPTIRDERSGTVEEATIASLNGVAHLLFWDGSIPRNVTVDDSQRQEHSRLEHFRRSIESEAKGLYGTFESSEDLKKKIDLILWSHANSVQTERATAESEASGVEGLRLNVGARGPVWRSHDLDKLVRVFAESSARERKLSQSAASDFVESSVARKAELEVVMAANAGFPVVVEVSTMATRILDLRIEISFADVWGVTPENEKWHAAWRTPRSDFDRFGVDIVVPIFASLPRGSMSTWAERAYWEAHEGDVVLTVEVDDLRRKRTPSLIEDEVVLWIPEEFPDPDGGVVTYSWEASGQVGGETVTESGVGELEITSLDEVKSRLIRWWQGNSNEPDSD